MKVLRWILILGLSLLIILYGIWFYPPLLAIGFAVAQRSPLCTISQAFLGAQASLKYHKIENRYMERRDSLFKLINTDSTGFHRWQTPEGNYWISIGSDRVLPVLIAQQAANIYGSPAYGVRPGDIVLDCGAHIGVFTRKALELGASKVIAIEPGVENLECLRRNLKQEISSGRVTIYPKGVWDREAVLEFHTFPDNSAADSFVTDSAAIEKTYKVEVITIDELVHELGLAKVDFIKMDIKGSTERALSGAVGTLRGFSPRLAISTEETADNPARIIELCRRLQPAYKRDCGYCAIEKGLLLPMVVFFHQ